MEYQYPIDVDWSQEEMIDVIHFFNRVEDYYERQVDRDDFMNAYRNFKKVVPGKADEKNILDDFEKGSGYNNYRAIKRIKNETETKKFSAND
ncbi:hypothetical protein HMPREF2798_06930 [Staphylococcus sp. HMSC070A03]|uniref:UPF0223 family protein n=1 Tax=Staphylococcus sp. HMSC070A03 TaxID=1739302 RepID=UPI0008A90E00|nr:UPF0223 family protein [Staphylococcus sp. HMSC070A03]OHR53971.1 hypothetical protein HMPREF2798_06930 [Staphylococcus sp. HMSC070A03]